MIGPCEDTAIPTIMCCSSDIESRKKLQKSVKRSGLIEKLHPAIKTGHMAQQCVLLVGFNKNTDSTDYFSSSGMLYGPLDDAAISRLAVRLSDLRIDAEVC